MSIIREFAKFIEPTGELEYDNTTSGLSATTIKSAIDELNTLLGGGNVGSQSTFSIYEFAASGGQTTFNLSSTFTVGGDVTAGDFITNETYKIQTTGTTDFTLIGASDSNPGTVFTATGAGAGTGTARVAVTYIPGYIQVYINGVFIASTDYTASDGQTVVLTEAAEASDLVTVVVLDSFNVATQLRVINVDASAPDDSLVIDNVGDVSVTSDIKLADNGKLILGDSSDLQIYSDGTTGQITGNVNVTGSVTADGLTVDSTNNSGNTGTPTIVIKDLDTVVSAGQYTGAVEFETSDASNSGVNSYIRSVMTGTGGAGSLTFGTGFAGSLADRVLINDNGDISFYSSDGLSQALFWDASAESLGIGTSSPSSARLQVKGAGTTVSTNAIFAENSAGAGLFTIRDNGEAFLLGNVGIGVAPSAWASAYKVLQIGSASSMFNTGSGTLFAANAYIDSGFAWRYQNSSYSSRYTMESGGHAWYIAPSGTAGDAVGFTQAMTLDASGNVGIGVVPTAAYKMQVNVATNTVSTGSPVDSSLVHIAGGTTTVGDGVSLQLTNISGAKETGWRISAVTASGNNGDLVFNGYAGGADYPERMRITAAGALQLSDVNSPNDINTAIYSNSDVLEFEAFGTNGAIAFTTGSSVTERMRIDVSGNVGIGTASPSSYPVAPNLVVDTKGNNGGITIKTGSTNYGGVYFADGTTGDEEYRGSIQYSHDYVGVTDSMQFSTAGAERMRIDEFGGLAIKSVGGATTAGFYGGNLVNGITAVPSGVGTPFVLGRDTGTSLLL